ncbi:D-ribose ABC superfamily ATP binding cassette transporter, ABC protein [Bifidobacterium margollesii]|uniref:D-ribose ABC superfamily ATP binding cassette transporter, ABC protein n=1 Tax=Bifidobacterium margollesii TaxID=2020964 RepID=A0A2N5J833_9BIFI|nr:sugar ABC transporter ATP-binding protein [Bifidobacterium margollesii]PLS30355.1 D-ribose ABC superfamily ATP binding cassette transporter, ABC protein [Bifidobacterium margollesii]
MTEKQPIVVMKGITIEFPGVKALDGVNLRLFPGEVHALMGENGAGKSTMIKALTGVYKIDAGSITVDGKPTQLNGTLDAQNAGIATVYQEVNLCTNLSIGENVMLGHEKRGPLGIDWKKTHAEARKHLAKMGLEYLDPRAPLSSISIAMQQLVAIARAMVIDAKVLILDEPTSSLDANEVEDLFEIMRKVRDSGVAILFVSHFLDQIYEITDRLTILRNGQFIKEVMTKETPRDELIGMMIGKSADELSQIGAKKARREIKPGEKPVVSIKKLGRKGQIEPTDQDVYAGEVVGFAGLLGSGRTELGRLMFGADKPDNGEYYLNGKKVNIDSPYTALKNKIAYSTENRRDEGIIGDLTVRQNMLIALQATRGMFKPIPKKEADEIVDKYMKELNVRPPDPNKLIKNLSGGNQQKVLIARWLAVHPELLILDEPTRGIDIGAKAEIQQKVLELAAQGMGVVFISSELEEVVRLSDAITVLKDHQKIANIVNDDTVSQATIVETIANSGKEA